MSILDRLLSLFSPERKISQPTSRLTGQPAQTSVQPAEKIGQLSRGGDQGAIEAHGLRLQATIEVRKFTEEEIRAYAKENRAYFEPAFWQVANGIQASKAALDALLPELLVAHTSGAPRRAQQVVIQHLPQGSWRWPAYEEYLLKRDTESFEEELADIKSSNLVELLGSLTIQELRNIYKQYCNESSKSPGKKKADIIATINASITESNALNLTETLRSRLIEDLDKPGVPDYKEMCSAFANKVSLTAYGVMRRQQMLEMADRHPMWQFIVNEREGMPKECRKLHDKTFRYDDPFWDTNYPPCAWPECSCRVRVVMHR